MKKLKPNHNISLDELFELIGKDAYGSKWQSIAINYIEHFNHSKVTQLIEQDRKAIKSLYTLDVEQYRKQMHEEYVAIQKGEVLEEPEIELIDDTEIDDQKKKQHEIDGISLADAFELHIMAKDISYKLTLELRLNLHSIFVSFNYGNSIIPYEYPLKEFDIRTSHIKCHDGQERYAHVRLTDDSEYVDSKDLDIFYKFPKKFANKNKFLIYAYGVLKYLDHYGSPDKPARIHQVVTKAFEDKFKEELKRDVEYHSTQMMMEYWKSKN